MAIVIKNKILPISPYRAMAIYPFIFTKEDLTPTMMNHELIHFQQQKELWIIPFYILYVLFFLWNLIRLHPRPYRAIPFEEEAYSKQEDMEYLELRPKFYWTQYL